MTILASLLLVSAAAQSPNALPSPKAAINYGKLPLSFEPNRGQTAPSVQFVARGSGYAVYLEPTRATLALGKPVASSPRKAADARMTRQVIRLDLVGASKDAVMTGEKSLPGYVTYMPDANQSNWHVGIPTFASTRVNEVYPGISLVYYGTGHELEYDFLVAPNADPNAVRLSLQGAHPILESSGDLRLQAGSTAAESDVLLRKPTLYQQIEGTRRPVDGAYTVASNGEVGFSIGRYDRSQELVIDPVIAYASYYGGGVADYINGSTLNSANQLYAVGHTYSANLPSTTGELDTNNPYNAANSGGLGFVTKFSADGSAVLWSTFLGGQANGTSANAVAVSSSDQAYVTGSTGGVSETQNGLTYTNTPLFPITSDALQTLSGPNGNGAYGNPNTGETSFGGTTVFLVKLSSDGKSLLYGTFLGGSTDDEAFGIALDTASNIYLTGHTYSTGYTYAVGANQSDIPSYPVNNHGQAAFGVANFPTTLSAFQSNTAESKMHTTTDGAGNVFGPADEQAFFSVISADGHSLLYSTLIGGGNLGGCGNGNCNTNSNAIAVSPQGIAFIGGNTSSQEFPVSSGALVSTCSGDANNVCPLSGWLAAFDRTKSGAASRLFSTYMTGSSGGTDGSGNNLRPSSSVNGLTTDATGNVYATGYTYANNFPTTANVLQPTCALGYNDGNSDHNTCGSAFVTKLTSTGSPVWSTYYRGTNLGSSVVNGSGIAVDASNDVYVIASSNEASVPLKNAFSSSPNGADALLFELAPDASQLVFGTYIGAVGGVTVSNNSLQLDSDLNAYFTGTQTFANNATITFPTTPGAFSQGGFGNSTVSYVAKVITQQQVSSTALQIAPISGAPGTSISFTATVTGLAAFPAPSGTVTLTSGTAVLGTITLAKGTGVFTTSTLTAGIYGVIAAYSGDAIYSTSSTTAQTVSIQNTPTVTLTAAPATASVGASVALTATVASTAGTPTGTVYFMDGTANLRSSVLSAGVATYATTALAAGSHTLTALYGGDAKFVTLPSNAQTVTISLNTPTVALTVSPATANVGTAIAFGVTVSGAAGTPIGTVKFMDGTALLSTVSLANGVASYSATALAAGTHTITASYSGDGTFSALISSTQTVTINKLPSAVALTVSPLTAIVGTSIALSATVSGSGGTPTGTVTFLDGTTTLSMVALTNGAASYATSTLAAGTHTITASYSGDSTFGALVSTAQTLTINALTPTVTVSANPSTVTVKRGSTVTSVITVVTANAYVGAITFSCATLPTAASCSFSAPTLTFTTGTATTQTSTITISTTAATTAMLYPTEGAGTYGTVLAALLLLPAAFTRRGRWALRGYSLASLLLIVSAILTLGTLSGCSDSSGPAAATTPVGTYTIPLRISGAPAGASLSLQLIVQ